MEQFQSPEHGKIDVKAVMNMLANFVNPCKYVEVANQEDPASDECKYRHAQVVRDAAVQFQAEVLQNDADFEILGFAKLLFEE